MITRWTVSNFKSVREPQTIEFGPLTLLCGANSAGKSSILQSMLLFAQSTSARLQPQALQLNGRFVQLGTMYEVIHGRSAESFSIAADFRLPADPMRYQYGIRQAGKISASLSTTLIPARADSGIEPGNPQVDAVSLSAAATGVGRAEVRARRRRGGPAPSNALPSEPIGTILSNERYLIAAEDTSDDPADRALHPHAPQPPAGVDLQGPVPIGLWGTYNPVARQAQRVIRDTLISPLRVRASATAHLPRFIEAAAAKGLIAQPPDLPRTSDQITAWVRSLKPTERRIVRTFVADYVRQLAREQPQVAFERQLLSPLLSNVATGIVQALTQIRHVGPLREAPRALYALPVSADPLEVGSRGEFTPAVLHRFRHRRVPFLWEGELLEESLGDAVDRWLAYLGVHEGAVTEDYGRLGHVLTVRDSDVPVPLDLTQVGVGVSQLLPIIAQGLLTPAGGTVLFEQPELHLHPAVQSRLADFLVSIARAERLVVCETHSEYLINRLRIRLGTRTINETDIAIYFVDRDAGVTHLEKVHLDKQGRIRNWPQGFFDQSALDAAELVDLQLRG